MPQIDRRVLVAIPIAAIVVFIAGFAVGRATGGDSEVTAAADTADTESVALTEQDDTTTTVGTSGDEDVTETTFITGDPTVAIPERTDVGDIPEYGTDEDRAALITGLVEAGVAGGAGPDILAAADYVCYTLERLRAQGRSLSFAVRVVWNDSLAELEPNDLAAFGAVLSAAPPYLCPENEAFGERVSYWLGY